MPVTAVPNVKSWVTAQHKESLLLAAGQGMKTIGKHFVQGMEWENSFRGELLTQRSFISCPVPFLLGPLLAAEMKSGKIIWGC